MNCKQAEELLIEYLYQELSAKKTVEVEKHLKSCSLCKTTLSSWQAIHRGYQRTVEAPQPSPYLKQRILSSAREEMRKDAPVRQRLFLWLKLATIPISIFALVILFQSWKKQPQVVQEHKVGYQSPKSPAPVYTDSETRKDAGKAEGVPPAKRELPPVDSATIQSDSPINEELKVQQELTKNKALEARQKNDMFASKLERDQAAGTPPPAPAAIPEQQTFDERQPPPAASEPAMKKSMVEAQRIRAEKPQEAEGKGRANAAEQFRQSQALFQNKDTKSGMALAKEAVSNDQDKALAPQLYESAKQFQDTGEYAQAIVQYNLVLNNYAGYKETPDVLLRLGDSYAQLGKFDEAKNAYQQLQKFPNQQKIATQRMQDLARKQQAEEELRSLGYVKQ